jgi:predicted CoA-binding protein
MKKGVEEFLAEKRIAVVGVSRKSGFGNQAFRTLAAQGYEVFPVNSEADTVEGKPCYRNLAAIPGSVGGVVTVVPRTSTLSVVKECLGLGIKHVWMQLGSDSLEAIEAAQAGNMNVVHHACILMYAQPKSIHKFHSWINKLLGKL